MLASFLIIGFSLVLLVYWFRFSCILLLRNAAEEIGETEDNRFSYPQVQARLKTEPTLAPLEAALDRDYRLLTYLLQHAAGLSLDSVEERLLVLDYKVMQWWYRLTKTAAPQQARRALKEMASVVGVLAGRLSQQAGLHSEA